MNDVHPDSLVASVDYIGDSRELDADLLPHDPTAIDARSPRPAQLRATRLCRRTYCMVVP
jgi:hypothetical protein